MEKAIINIYKQDNGGWTSQVISAASPEDALIAAGLAVRYGGILGTQVSIFETLGGLLSSANISKKDISKCEFVCDETKWQYKGYLLTITQ